MLKKFLAVAAVAMLAVAPLGCAEENEGGGGGVGTVDRDRDGDLDEDDARPGDLNEKETPNEPIGPAGE